VKYVKISEISVDYPKDWIKSGGGTVGITFCPGPDDRCSDGEVQVRNLQGFHNIEAQSLYRLLINMNKIKDMLTRDSSYGDDPTRTSNIQRKAQSRCISCQCSSLQINGTYICWRFGI
jgi:hypothetical protein